MQQDYYSLIKNVFIEYTKSHNECCGKILEILNNIKVAQSLPLNVQEELKRTLYNALILNGVSSILFK